MQKEQPFVVGLLFSFAICGRSFLVIIGSFWL